MNFLSLIMKSSEFIDEICNQIFMISNQIKNLKHVLKYFSKCIKKSMKKFKVYEYPIFKT
jgi:hypothetical protein